MENTQFSGGRKKNKKSRLVAIIAAAVLVVATLLSVVFGMQLPTNERLASADGSRFLSIATTEGDEWFYTTSNGNIFRMNGDNEVVEEFNLSQKMQAEYGVGTSTLRSFIYEAGMEYMYVGTSNRQLIQISDKDGKLAINDVLPLNGYLADLTECTETGELFIITQVNRDYEIASYDLENISAGHKNAGYLYRSSVSQNVAKMTLLKNLVILSFDVLQDADGQWYAYLMYDGGLLRMRTDFKDNKWGAVLPSLIDEEYNKLIETEYQAEYDDALAKELAKDPTATIDTIDTAKLQKQIETELKEKANVIVCKENGLESYDIGTGEVKFPANRNELFNSYAVFNPDGITYRGCVYAPKDNKYYLATSDAESKLYSYDVAALSEVSALKNVLELTDTGIALPQTPQAEGNALNYNETLHTLYVFYEASQDMSCIDLTNMEMRFTAKADFDIANMRQSGDGNRIYYLYYNANEAETGHLILRTAVIENQDQESMFSVLMTISIILAVGAAIVVVFALGCFYNEKFAAWFMDVMHGFVKQWGIYLILLGCLILLCMFCYYPAVGSISLSFYDYTQDKPARIWNNFAHYKQIFTSATAAEEFFNMFFFLFFDLLVALAPPLIFAFCLTIMRSKKYSGITRTLLFIPGIIPGVATTLIWRTGIFGSDGVLNTLIEIMNGNPIRFLEQTSSAKWSLVLMGFPYVGSYLIFYGAMMNVPDSYYEAAELDGITVWKRFFFIDIPLIFAQIKYVFVMTFIASVQNFGRVYMVTRGEAGTKTPIYTMYVQINDYKNYGLSSAYATVLFIFLLAATIFNLRKQKREQGGIA